MNRKWFWVGVPVIAVLAVAASVFLRDHSAPLPEDEEAEAPAQQLEAVRAAPDTPALPAAPPSGSAIEDVWDFDEGDLTTISVSGDGLGYLDVDAITNRNDPSSIVAFLQTHSDDTGADEPLEIEIVGISKYPTSKSVIINQLIDGKRLPHGSGDITFDPATGAVISAYVSLVTPDPALAASVVILQDEAVAIARAFVTSAVLEEKTVAIESDSGRVGVRPRLRPGFALDIYSVTPKELRYAVDWETNKARVEWPVWISADLGDFTPGISWEVLVDASTGEIVGIRNLDQPYAGVCSDLTYRVFDGSSMDNQQQAHGTRLPDTDPWPAAVIGHAKGMTASINAADPDYIGDVRGTDCEVDIVINVPDEVVTTLEGPAAGLYQEGWDRILVRAGTTKPTVAHEVMHALTRTTSGDVEHGIVTAAESLHVGFGWRYAGEDFTDPPPSVSFGRPSGTHHSVAHVIYRILGATNKDTAFKIVLGTDRQNPYFGNVHGVIFREAKKVGAEAAVTGIYEDMGIWPSQADIDNIVASVMKEMKRTFGQFQVPPQDEMEDKIEELVNEELRNGEFHQRKIINEAVKKAKEYRLEKVEELNNAKEEYKKRLREAMAQLTNAERAEIQGQYSDAQRKIQAATTVAIAQWNWEWIREVIERIIERRDNDGMQVPVAPRSPPERPGHWPPGRPRPPGD